VLRGSDKILDACSDEHSGCLTMFCRDGSQLNMPCMPGDSEHSSTTEPLQLWRIDDAPAGANIPRVEFKQQVIFWRKALFGVNVPRRGKRAQLERPLIDVPFLVRNLRLSIRGGKAKDEIIFRKHTFVWPIVEVQIVVRQKDPSDELFAFAGPKWENSDIEVRG
jgi:hypothetical protein